MKKFFITLLILHSSVTPVPAALAAGDVLLQSELREASDQFLTMMELGRIRVNVQTDQCPDISAILAWDGKNSFTLCVDTQLMRHVSLSTQRAILAHEIGHIAEVLTSTDQMERAEELADEIGSQLIGGEAMIAAFDEIVARISDIYPDNPAMTRHFVNRKTELERRLADASAAANA